jgi:para-aminobenzoate synthetase/4-amino-4-deoxychorismate lyase
VVVALDGALVTPPVSCGLLPGTLRADLVESGRVVERVVRIADLARVERIWLVNSVRGWMDARLVSHAASTTSPP